MNNDNPLISVVIPAYNREKLINMCLDSVLNQTYKNLEILVVDDGSTDKTVDVVRKIKDSRIKIIQLNSNSGAQRARNEGIKNASGEWVAFHDSDDTWYPNKIEKQVEILKQNNWDRHLVIHTDGVIKYYSNDTIAPIARPELNGENVYSVALSCNAFLFPTALTSKDALMEIGLLDERVLAYQEWDTAIRLAKKCKFIHIPEPLFVYHRHQETTISGDESRGIKGYLYILKKHKADMINFVSRDYYKNQMLFLYNKCLHNDLYFLAFKVSRNLGVKTMLKSVLKIIAHKKRNGDNRKIIIFGFIKISYKKRKSKKDIQKDQQSDYPRHYHVEMSGNEREFFLEHIKNTKNYLEFGSGGSTFMVVLEKGIKNILSVESDNNWLDFLRRWKVIADAERGKRLNLKYIDIGPVGNWGVPLDNGYKDTWPNYSKQVFDENHFNNKYDFVFIDGRYRVACALQVALNCPKNTKIMMHDFNNRPGYHIILKYLSIIDTMDTMALFEIKENVDKDMLIHDYETYKFISD